MVDKPNCDSVIAYVPLRGEPRYAALGLPRPVYVIPPFSDTDVAMAMREAKTRASGEACVLVPGRAFDRTGTRHGRGGGWYDRFLSCAPREWIAVGVTTPDRVSDAPLTRKPHDMPMDWLAIVSETGIEWLEV